ncbi:MAG: DUF5694 domain-containing protein [Thermoanaerobaculia bacterium]
MTKTIRMRTAAAFAICLSFSLDAAGADKRPRSGFSYDASLADTAKTQILVLGTPHLAAMKNPPGPAALAPLIAALETFEPDVIGVERIAPHILLAMQQRSSFMAEVAAQFGGRYLDNGRAMQAALGTSAAEAAARVASALHTDHELDEAERLRLVADMLAAYDYSSAVLQWSYVPEAARHSEAAARVVPADVAASLDESLRSPNEVYSIAVTLARRRGLQQIAAIDDQSDAAIVAEILELHSGELEKIENHPETKALRQSPARKRSDAAYESGLASAEGLLRFYRFINSAEATDADVAGQWGRYFRTKLPSGVDRSRVAQWEVRNLLIAAHVREASALKPGGRVLVLIGSAHKPFLDRYLSQMLDVRVRQLEELTGGAECIRKRPR